MGYSVGYDPSWKRDVGYGVPAICDHPDCSAEIDRGLAYVCGGQLLGGGDGCGLYFCAAHLSYYGAKSGPYCERCRPSSFISQPFDPKPDFHRWIMHKLTHGSWAEWRANHPELVRELVLEINKVP